MPGFDVIGFAARFHPVAVHFPVALVIGAGVAELFGMLRKQDRFAFTVRFLLYLAAAGSVLSAVLGFAAASGESYTGALAANFTRHRLLGVASPVLIFLTLGLAESAKRTNQPSQRVFFRVMLLLTMIVVGVAGYFGATLVFGADHFHF